MTTEDSDRELAWCSMPCPSCGGGPIAIAMRELPGTHAPDVYAAIVLNRCKACDFTFSDKDARHPRLPALYAEVRALRAELARRRALDLREQDRALLRWVAKEIAHVTKTEDLGENERIAAPIAIHLLNLLAGSDGKEGSDGQG